MSTLALDVISGPDATRAEWLAARHQGIGGSDVSAILGMNRYSSPLSVWLDKTGQSTDDDAGEAAEWGTRIEPLLAEKWAEVHPDHALSIESPGLLARSDAPWMLATPDRLVIAPDEGMHIWEGKTAGTRTAHRWDDDAVPDEYALQVHWYLTVTGAKVGHVSALLAGQRYVERTITADPDMSAMLTDRVGAWWELHVVQGVMPDPDPARDGELLGALWSNLNADPHDIDDLAPVVEDLRAVRAQLKALEAREAALLTSLKTGLGEHTEGYIGGELAVTWRASKPRTSFDAKALAADDPDTHARYLRTGTPVRSLRLK